MILCLQWVSAAYAVSCEESFAQHRIGRRLWFLLRVIIEKNACEQRFLLISVIFYKMFLCHWLWFDKRCDKRSVSLDSQFVELDGSVVVVCRWFWGLAVFVVERAGYRPKFELKFHFFSPKVTFINNSNVKQKITSI